MNSGIIDLSTGPVNTFAEVRMTLSETPVAHRSDQFRKVFDAATSGLCREFNTRNCFLLTGSGTLANEAMLQQILQREQKGIVLSNGEFGERLVAQADRIGLKFFHHGLPWGQPFCLNEVSQLFRSHSPGWILFTHCETSTGLINPLAELTNIAKANDTAVFVDCMSTVGTRSIDLSGITMATASSGKGLASIPGLAIVFSNIKPVSSSSIPLYLDLGHYDSKSGIPFTISSNQVSALLASISKKLTPEHYTLVDDYRNKIRNLLYDTGLLPYHDHNSFVFTLAPCHDQYIRLLDRFSEARLRISYESEYLVKRKWIQLALFNYYREEELRKATGMLQQAISIPSRVV